MLGGEAPFRVRVGFVNPLPIRRVEDVEQATCQLEGLAFHEVAQEMLSGDALLGGSRKLKEDAHMLGRLLVATIAGVVAWKYRDALTEYVKGNAGPVREKIDGLLLTAQERSETLLGRAKEQISSGLEGAREKLSVERFSVGNLSTGASRAADGGRLTE